MSHLTMEQSSEETLNGPAAPYSGLRGHELVGWALRSGPGCVISLGGMQKQYFEAVSRRAGVDWPEGFFASTLEELMPQHAVDPS